MNDLSEPFVLDKRFGGVGSDYHGIAQASSHIISYVLNETGYGRWLQNQQKRGKSLEVERRWEAFSIGKIAQSRRDDPQFALNWETTFAHLDKIYNAAKDKNIRLVLMIFPHTYQFMNDRMKEHQRQLIEHAESKNIDVIDFTQVFEDRIFDEHIESQLYENGFSLKDMRRMYNPIIRKYFLDSDHYTVEGHRVVASHLYSYISENFSF